jgi:hypothetical protein
VEPRSKRGWSMNGAYRAAEWSEAGNIILETRIKEV